MQVRIVKKPGGEEFISIKDLQELLLRDSLNALKDGDKAVSDKEMFDFIA
jgi:hypothetical protein